MSVKQEWVDALRSGNYQQRSGSLYDSYYDAYCCLGVLCEIKGRNVRENTDLRKLFPEPEFTDHDNWHVPPQWLDYRIQSQLVALNDSSRHKFPAIADWIEKNLDDELKWIK